jgi:hypothetical protein
MVVGMWCDVYVHESGASRPTNYCHSFQPVGGPLRPDTSKKHKVEFNSFIYYWPLDGNGIAQLSWPFQSEIQSYAGGGAAGKNYTVEMDLTLFETDYNGRIGDNRKPWNPKSARYYKILWQRTLKTVTK